MPKHQTIALHGESIQTTDATVTDLSTFQTEKSKAYLLEGNVVALNTALTTAAGYKVYAVFRTDAAGVLTQVGATTATATMEDTGAWTVTVDASGTTIRVRATGAAATTINWRADVKVNQVGLAAERT